MLCKIDFSPISITKIPIIKLGIEFTDIPQPQNPLNPISKTSEGEIPNMNRGSVGLEERSGTGNRPIKRIRGRTVSSLEITDRPGLSGLFPKRDFTGFTT